MDCPTCQHRLYVRNSYSIGPVRVQDMACRNPKCKTKVVTKTEIVVVNPARGQGAHHVAAMERLK